MRPILQKKGENLDFTLFFEFECLNMHDITDYDSTNGSGLLRNHELPVSMALCKIRLIMCKKSQDLDY